MTNTAFFGYPSKPAGLAETVREAARKIEATGTATTSTWEDLPAAGYLVIDTILQAINLSTVCCFEITGLNLNVMFEFGYAIGQGKRIWPLVDESDIEGKKKSERLRLLTTVGYVPYVNSDDIRAAYLRDMPHLSADSLFDLSIRPNLQAAESAAVFYLKTPHQTNAARDLSRRIEKETFRRGRLITLDPSEATVYPLTWYAQQIYSASVTIVHFSAMRRAEADIHSARGAFVAGLACGMGKTILMLAEEDQLTPIDYRDLTYVYQTSRDLIAHVDAWLAALPPLADARVSLPRRAAALELETELRSVHFGEPVAENEVTELPSYFVPTSSYDEVLRRATTVFVGRKGAGKSANFLQAAAKLKTDPSNVVCVIQPSGYELEAVVRLLSRFGVADERTYAIEALWQYLLYTEIARAAVAQLRERPAMPVHGSAEWKLVEYVDDPKNGINDEFAIRLERVVESALKLQGFESIAEARAEITKALHAGQLQDLRRLLGDALADRERVAVLIDNLDKAWDRTADLPQLAHLLLGLLSAVRKVDSSFARTDAWRRRVVVTLAVFLRSDIFEKVVDIAREPDKIPVSRLLWTDRALLIKVIDERYRATHFDSSPGELWEKYFVPDVGGRDMRTYILDRILPRPRDMVQFCSFALSSAVNGNHPRIDVEDIRSAERNYSQFAFEALLVENGLTIEELEAVLLEFAGGESVVSRELAEDAVVRAGIDDERVPAVLARLRQLSFLGVETRDGVFAYEEDARDEAKFDALARNLTEQRGDPSRYQIHPAYRPYLEVVEGDA